MKRLHQVVAFAFLILWAPMTTHCLWEGQIGGDLFKCAAEKGDCSNDGDDCSTLEAGHYKTSDAQLAVPTPILTVVPFEIAIPTRDDFQQIVPQTTAPDEIPRSWHFSSRAALPPRAPSFVS